MSTSETATPASLVADGRAVLDRAAWTAAHREHLAAEKALTKARDEVSEKRRSLPWLEITEPYQFQTTDGPATLADLFGNQPQLVMYHFMMGAGWEEGCPSCSFWADNYNGIDVHLANRNTAFVVASRGPLDKLQAYRQRMGWDVNWVSSAGSSFNLDMGVSFDQPEPSNYNFGTQDFGADEAPGLSVFAKTDDGRIFLTHQVFSRGLELFNGAYHLLDLTPLGRDEGRLEWTMAWLRRHDSYDTANG